MYKFSRYLSLAAVVGLLGAAGPVWAWADELEEVHELSMEFETPHTDWAQPYARGKVRVLYFGLASYRMPHAAHGGIEARDIIELMQRFDIEANAAYRARIINTYQVRWYATTPQGTGQGINRIGSLVAQPCDCFVFNGIPITDLPTSIQNKVLNAVAEGAGLVLIGVEDERVVKPENKLIDVPPFLANDRITDAYRVNAGRAICLPERPRIAYHPGWEVDYDYWVERVGRAVLWAADRSPRVELTIGLDMEQIPRTELLEHNIAIQVSGGDLPENLQNTVRLRRADGAVFDLQPAPQNPSTYRFERRYRAGQYHIDAITRSKDGIEVWATVPIEITAARLVGAIELDKDWGEMGETISGTVKLNGDPLPGEMVRLQLLDARQRILVEADRPVSDSAASFEFPIKDWMPMLLEVRALVMDGKEEVSSKYAYVRVTKRHRGQFNFVVWRAEDTLEDDPTYTLTPYVGQQLARLGCTVQLAWGNPPLTLAANNIAHIPYTTHIEALKDENGYMKPVCWNDKPAVDEWVDSIVSKHEPSRQHGVFVYSLGDEIATTGCCVHPACLAAYRRYLQQQYGDIAALNGSWGSEYASFEQVNLLVEGDNDEAKALQQKTYPRWYDRQAFKGYNFVKLCERFGKRFKEMDPRARTGFEGAGDFAGGTDIDLICRTNGFWAPYAGPVDEVIGSIGDRDFIRSNWIGYYKDADSLLRRYWRIVTGGADSVWWWTWDGIGTFRGLLAPHMAPWPAVKEMHRDTQIVRDGLGSLLLKCRREDDGIAILYSYPSTFANKIEAGPTYGEYEATHKLWQQILRALGLQFSYVSDRMLRRGEFRARHYKVLILPQTEAIGPQEAEVIRAFAENGGTVIADVRPGIYDGHCKPLEQGVLDDLFGIERVAGFQVADPWSKPDSSNVPAVCAAVVINSQLGDYKVALPTMGCMVDPAVRAISGQPLGKANAASVCIINQVGRGRGVLLNFTMDSFPRTYGGRHRLICSEPAPPEATELVSALLAWAGVEPEVTVTDLAGNPVRDTEVIRWRGHGVDFLALFGGQRAEVKDELVQVHLPDAQHVYDLREHVYRGRTATFKVHKMPRRATFIALSTRELSGPQLRLSRTPIARGEQLTVQLSYPGSRAYHAARLRVYQPDGAPAEWLDQVVIVGPEGARVTLPIAYNDPAGQWTVHVIDLYTDEKAETRLRVE